MNFRNAWESGTRYALNDSVTWNGSTYLAVDVSQNVQPDSDVSKWTVIAQAGGAGPTGPMGQAPTVVVGTAPTGAAGRSAAVSATTTATGVALNFTIPQGATGAAGSSGTPPTATGSSFAATYHAVDYNAYYFSINNQNKSANEDTTILTWVPVACTATQLSVYSLQSSTTLTVTLRNGTPGAMSDVTALSCMPDATTKSCTASGSVSIAAGSFLDLHITSASSYTAPVWTSVQCN